MSSNVNSTRARWAGVGAAVAVTLGAVGVGSMNFVDADDITSGDRAVFVSVAPCRLVDTRPTAPIGPDSTITVTAHGSNGECIGVSEIPTDAISLSLNVTAVGPTADTFLTFWGTGPNPGTSNLNPSVGSRPTPNAVNTPLSDAGTFNIFNSAGDVDVIVDVNGYYAPHNHDDRYYSETESDERFVQGSDKVLISGLDFVDHEGGDWSWDNTIVQHNASASTECLSAPVELPEGVDVTATQLIYFASNSAEVSVSLASLAGVDGPVTSDGSFSHDVAEVFATVPASPEQELSALDLELGDFATKINPGRFNYFAEICTAAEITIVGLELSVGSDS